MAHNNHYKVVEKLIQYLREHQNEQPSLEDISQQVHLSKYHLQRVFKEWAGVTPKQFLQYLTTEHSKELLRKGKSTLETAHQAGLSGNGRLHDLFIKCQGLTPGEYKNFGKGLVIQYGFADTPFGKALIAETAKGLCKVSFVDDNNTALTELEIEFPAAEINKGLAKNGLLLENYFATWKRPQTKINIHFKGTPFQIQVWQALLKIPASQLASYQDIGHIIGKPKAVRAIGTAIGKNPIAYLIPCNRVIKSNGLMGQYRWKANRKVIINAFECSQF